MSSNSLHENLADAGISDRLAADKGQYQDFLKCLNLYAQDICSRHELSAAVQDVLGRYPELLVCQVPMFDLSAAMQFCLLF